MSNPTQTSDIHWMIGAQAELDRLRFVMLEAADALDDPGCAAAVQRDLRFGIVAPRSPGLRAGEFTATHTGPLTAEQLADKLRDG